MGAEPSRRLFGGHAAVQSKKSSGAASNGPARARLGRSRMATIAVVAGSALVAITAAAALPLLARKAPQASTDGPVPPRTLSPQLAAAPAPAADEADVAARRFTGRVGENLSDSLSAAGVPQRAGREYV